MKAETRRSQTSSQGGAGTERCASRPALFTVGNWLVERSPQARLSLGHQRNEPTVAIRFPASAQPLSPVIESSFIHRICPGIDRIRTGSVGSRNV